VRVHLEERVAIAAPPEAVFAAVADWEGQSDWVALTRVTGDGGPHRVGERLVAETGVAGIGFRDPMEVTRFDPPRRIDVRHLGRVVRGTGSFRVEPAPGGAFIVWVEDVDLPLGVAGRLGFAVVGPAFRLLLRRSLRRLARQVESRPHLRRRPGGNDPGGGDPGGAEAPGGGA
jgi:carbon monoxide dehydrogenase subunit G